MTGAQILGTGRYVPECSVSNFDLATKIDTTDEWIRSRTGIESRRVAADDETAATMGTAAGSDALKHAGLAPGDVDLILIATCTPDLAVPGTASLVQASLGASNAGTMDVNVGCSGFIYGLATAASLIKAKVAGNVLLIGAEVLSRVTDWSDRTTCVLFGDAAGAVVIGPSDEDKIGPFTLGADGSRPDALYVRAPTGPQPAPGSILEANGFIHMKGQDVYKHATDRMTEATLRVLGDDPVGEIDLMVAHQANARIIATVAERLGLREDQVVYNLASYGNTSSATIPVTLADLAEDQRLRPGMRLVLAAFGAGFAWGAAKVIW